MVKKIFFLLTYVKPKYQKIEHNQTDANNFQQVIWLSWVCWQSPVWYKIDCSHLISGIVCYQLQTTWPWRIVQWEIFIKKLNKTRAHSVTEPSPYTAEIFFCQLSPNTDPMTPTMLTSNSPSPALSIILPSVSKLWEPARCQISGTKLKTWEKPVSNLFCLFLFNKSLHGFNPSSYHLLLGFRQQVSNLFNHFFQSQSQVSKRQNWSCHLLN